MNANDISSKRKQYYKDTKKGLTNKRPQSESANAVHIENNAYSIEFMAVYCGSPLYPNLTVTHNYSESNCEKCRAHYKSRFAKTKQKEG